jgi:hypothetical protein
MSACRWDRDAEDYLIDGKPCRTDDYGDPTRHCKARKTCSNHVGQGEITCARCISRCRADIRQLSPLASLMWTVAIAAGEVTTDAAMYAGPAADMDEYAENREAVIHQLDTSVRRGTISEKVYLKELGRINADDESHPANVLGVWCRMWAEHYGLTMPNTAHLEACIAFIDANLHRVAQDETQDFPQFVREVRDCRQHMESTLRNSHAAERGAPCPICKSPAPKLRREYGHWCDNPDCEKIHYGDDAGDRWICPNDRDHWWWEEDYRLWVADVYEANRSDPTPANA